MAAPLSAAVYFHQTCVSVISLLTEPMCLHALLELYFVAVSIEDWVAHSYYTI